MLRNDDRILSPRGRQSFYDDRVQGSTGSNDVFGGGVEMKRRIMGKTTFESLDYAARPVSRFFSQYAKVSRRKTR